MRVRKVLMGGFEFGRVIADGDWLLFDVTVGNKHVEFGVKPSDIVLLVSLAWEAFKPMSERVLKHLREKLEKAVKNAVVEGYGGETVNEVGKIVEQIEEFTDYLRKAGEMAEAVYEAIKYARKVGGR